MVERTVHSDSPPAVSYWIADDELTPVLKALCVWGERRTARDGVEIQPATRREIWGSA